MSVHLPVTLIMATGNRNKAKEISSKLQPTFHVLSLADIGCYDDIIEDGDTLEANALIKARYVTDRYKEYPYVFADDTGLSVDALGGRPGVYSARYAGEEATYQDNVDKMLDEMRGVADRSATFVTVIVLIFGGQTHYFRGEVKGQITTSSQGKEGFGYDPMFLPDGYDITYAEMDLKIKNQMSHRAIAVQKMIDFLSKQ